MEQLRLVFMGTPEFAVAGLAELLEVGHQVVCVYSQPPRPAGRGQEVRPGPVHAFAAARGLPVRTPLSLKDPAEQAAFAALGADVAVVAAYGLILPRPILAAPRLGCINIHASLLPRWRGAAPIQRALLAGDEETGISIMLMDEGLDTGPVLATGTLPIGPDTTAQQLHDRMAVLGAKLGVAALDGFAAGRLQPRAQPAEGVTYAGKLRREEGLIDFAASAETIDRQVRALNPWPGCWFEHAGERIKLLAARALAGPVPAAPPGLVLDEALTVACASGAVRLIELQRPGRAAMAAADFLNGFALPPGTRLGVGAHAALETDAGV